MTDTDTSIRSAKLRRVRGVNFVVLKVREMFNGEEATIADLATKMRLPPVTVLNSLVDLPSNALMRETLFQEQIGLNAGEDLPTEAVQRRKLHKAAVDHKDSVSGRNKQPSAFNFKQWKVIPPFDEPILLPLSSGFAKVLVEAAVNAKTRERLVEIAAPAFDSLRNDLDRVDKFADDLSNSLNSLEVALRPALQEFHFVDTLKKTLALMATAPKGGLLPDDPAQRAAATLQGLVEDLTTVAYREMVAQSPEQSTLRSTIASQARLLRGALSTAAILLGLYRDQHELAPEDLHDLIPKVLIEAYSVLFLTAEADDIIRTEVLPLLDMLSSVTIPPVPVDALDPDTQAGFNDVKGRTSGDTALLIMGSMIGLTSVAVGNLPGPASLCGAVLGVAQAHIQRVLTLRPDQLRNMSGRMLRALFVIGGIPKDLCIEVVDAIGKRQLGVLKGIDLTKSFQTGPRMATALSILFFIALIQACDDDEAGTLKRWASIIGNGLNFGLGVSQALGHIARLQETRIVTGLSRFPNAGMWLGGLAAIAGLITAGIAVQEEWETQDVGGVIVATASLAGSALSVAGFLMVEGFIAEGTVVGIPAGIVLQTVGTAIAIGAGIVTLAAALTTTGSHIVFEGLVEQVGRKGGLLDRIASKRLRDAFTAVKQGHSSVTFWDISADEIQTLAEYGYTNAHIALLINEIELFVAARVSRPATNP